MALALLTDYLTKKLLFENHPTLDEGTCLNTIQSKNPCSRCRDICPQGVFSEDDPNWDLCDNCGACAARCPTRAIRPSATLSENILALCGRIKGHTTFSCKEQDTAADLKAGCLAALPWELIALFSLDGTVSFAMAGCESCPKKDLLIHFEKTLEDVRQFMGDERYNASIQLHRDAAATKPEEKQYSRRDAFSLLFSKSKATVSSLLPENQELSPDGTLCRQLLAYHLKQLGDFAPGFDLRVPAFQESCYACGLCTNLCPNQALHRVDGNSQDGKHTWHMALIPWRCTNCGLCLSGCPVNGLQISSISSDITKPMIHTVTATPCPRCGEPTCANENADLCHRCQAETAKPQVF